jgi:sortase B
VRGTDNDHYLWYNFTGERGANRLPTYGTLFLLAENAADFSDANNVIQAHNMANGTMFAKIAELMDTAQFNAHRTVYVLSPQDTYRLSSIALVVSGPYEAVLQTSLDSREALQTYAQGLIDRSVVSPEPVLSPVGDIDKLVMFSTCTNDSGTNRCILVCTVAKFDERTNASV